MADACSFGSVDSGFSSPVTSGSYDTVEAIVA